MISSTFHCHMAAPNIKKAEEGPTVCLRVKGYRLSEQTSICHSHFVRL